VVRQVQGDISRTKEMLNNNVYPYLSRRRTIVCYLEWCL